MVVLVWAVGAACAASASATALAPPQIYWTNFNGDAIGVANLDGTAVNQTLITGASFPSAIAVNGQHMYWANETSGTIGEANLDGTGVNESFITGANLPRGVAIDEQHIYWTNNGSTTIGEANLDGTGVNQNFITGANAPSGLAVDGQHIYWSNEGSATIGIANLDGTGVNQSFISTGASDLLGLAVDGQHIYWANDGNPGTIGAANLDGTGANNSFIIGSMFARDVAVDDQRLYYSTGNPSGLGEANLDGTSVNNSFISANNAEGVAVSVPVVQVSPASPAAFGTTPQGTLGTPLTLTISNTGLRNLLVDGLTFAGSDPGDFLLTSNGCLGPVAPGESCQIGVSFAPQAPGARSAALEVATNDYANSPMAVALSGTGGSLPTGARGPAGQIELVVCKKVTKTVTKHGKKHKVTVQKCTTRLVSGKVKFTTGSRVLHATVSRAGVAYATGVATPTGRGQWELVLTQPLRRLKPGRYTLTLRGHGKHRIVARRTIVIT